MGWMACVLGLADCREAGVGDEVEDGSRKRMGQELEWCLLRGGAIEFGFSRYSPAKLLCSACDFGRCSSYCGLGFAGVVNRERGGLEVGPKTKRTSHPLIPFPSSLSPQHNPLDTVEKKERATNRVDHAQQQRALPSTEKAAFIRPLLFSDHPVFHLKTHFFPFLTVCASVQRPTRCAAAFRRGSRAISTRRPPLARPERPSPSLTSEKASDPPSPSHAFSSLHPTKPADAYTSPRTRSRPALLMQPKN